MRVLVASTSVPFLAGAGGPLWTTTMSRLLRRRFATCVCAVRHTTRTRVVVTVVVLEGLFDDVSSVVPIGVLSV